MSEAKSVQDKESSGWAKLGQACAMALAASLLAALPTAVRTRSAGGSLLDGLLVGAAVWLCLALPVALLRPRAARGWRGVVGADPPADLGVGVGMWAGLAALLLVLLGAALKATTHHRGLGGATYGVLGAAGVLAAAVLAARLLSLGRTLQRRGLPRLAVQGAMLVLALGPPLGLTLWASSGAGASLLHSAWVTAAIVDLLLAIAVLGLLVVRGLAGPLRKLGHVAALPVALVVLVAGFARVELSAGVSHSVRARGGVPAAALGLLEAWSDRDGDGAGAHFGGGDCDEGDPTRRPGREDVEGDGVDQDCDGRDGPRPVRQASLRASSSPSSGAAAPPSPSSGDGAPTRLATDVRPRASVSDDVRPGGAPAADAGAAAPAAGRAPSHPDIVLVTLDTVGALHSSTYGYDRNTTPALTKIAQGGTLFAHAFAIGSTTQRALTPLVTGRAISNSRRSADDWPTLLDDNDTVAERLQRAGYATAAVSSFTWLRQDRGFHQGFDHFDESPFRQDHPEHGTTGKAAVAAARRLYDELTKGERPLFLWVHLFDAHAKYLEHSGIDFGGDERGRYDGEVAYVDQRLAELHALVTQSPRAERTVLLVHGTHGVAFGEHDRRGHGREVYDEMIRVPLVIVAPWSVSRRLDDVAVSTLDVAPTVLDYAGASREEVEGVSLRPAVQGEPFERAPVLAYAWRRRGVVDWPYKLIARQREDRPARLLLFDLAADPQERRDVSADQPEALKRLSELLQGHEES